jgi:hypothetical protein
LNNALSFYNADAVIVNSEVAGLVPDLNFSTLLWISMMKVKCCRFLWWKWNARWSHVLLLLGFSEFIFNSMRILTKGKKYLQGTASFWKSTFFFSESVAIESRPKESFQMLWKYTHLDDKAKLLYKHFWAFESWLIFVECIWNFTSPT